MPEDLVINRPVDTDPELARLVSQMPPVEMIPIDQVTLDPRLVQIVAPSAPNSVNEAIPTPQSQPAATPEPVAPPAPRVQSPAPTSTPPPSPPRMEGREMTDEERKGINGQILDLSSGREDRKADIVDERIREMTSQPGVKGFLKKVWFGNLAHDYYRQRELSKVGREIDESQDLLVHQAGTKAEHHRAIVDPIMERVSEYGILHPGEKNDAMAELEGGEEFEARLKDIVTAFAADRIGYDALEEERVRLLTAFGMGQRQNDHKKGQLYADNIIEIAKNAKAAYEHGVGLADIEAALNIKVAEVSVGVRTAATRELTDRVIDKVASTKIGSMVNEATVATVAAVAIGATKFTTRKLVTALSATVGLGVGSAIVAGARKSHSSKQDRRLHARQMAVGGEIDPDNSKRRQAMEVTRYRTASAASLIEGLSASLEIADETDPHIGINGLLQSIVEAQTRIKMSDERNIDLIGYDGLLNVEQQRTDLDVALGKARARLQKFIDSQDVAALGITAWSIDQVVDASSEMLIKEIEADVTEKDVEFRHLRHKQMLSSAALGFVVGATIGEASEEIRALVDDGLKGVFEGNSTSADRTTELAAMFHHGDKVTIQEHAATDFSHSAYHDGNNALDLPKGYHIADGHDGAKELVGPDGVVVASHVGFDKAGNLNADTLKELQDKGFGLHTSHEAYQTSHTETQTVQSTTGEYIANHQSEFTTVHRVLWYDNNTPYSDHNELATWWGGQNNSGIDAQGNYVLNISHMTPGGSFEGSQSVDYATLLANHQLGLAVSLDQAHQSEVIMLHFNTDGNVIIPHDNPALASVFSNQNGHAVFTGGYAEVVQIGPTGPDGTAISMLSTLVGSNQPHTITDTVQTVVHSSGEHVITHIEVPHTTALPIEIAPVIPITPRTGLEALKNREQRRAYGYGNLSPEQLDQFARERSPRLHEDPNAVLNPGQELDWRRSQLEVEHPEILARIDEIINSTPELQTINESTKAIVCIPVAAKFEADNIYETLSLYEQQDETAKSQSTILLNVNWVDEDAENPETQVLIDRTLAEIERAKANFPDLKIAVMQSVMPATMFNNEREGVIGEIVSTLFDTALVSIDRANKEGRHNPGQEVLIIRNDADSEGMDHNYLSTMISASERSDSDAFVGVVRWGTKAHKQYPGFGVVSNFLEVMHAVTGLRAVDVDPSTVGINTAVKASSLAAVGSLGHIGYAGAGSDDIFLGNRINAARAGDGATGEKQPGRRAAYRTGSTRFSQSTTNDQRSRLAKQLGRLYYSASSGNTEARSGRQPISIVTGAGIDTDEARLLTIYRGERSITTTWDDFSKELGKGRNMGADDPSLIQADDLNDMDSVASRVELSINEVINNWYRDPGHVKMGLAFTFPEKDADGDAVYTLTKRGDQSIFKLTGEGKQWLQSRLQRDGAGRFDPFGNRARRRLYRETPAGGKIQPKTDQPRFVQALA